MNSSSHTPKDFIPVSTSIHAIACPKSWSQLDNKEKNYAYYMARAAWQGSRICWFQRSAESPALLVIFHTLFEDPVSLRANCKHLSEEQWQQLCAYVAAVFQNCGNFKSFGDTKFVPEISPAAFDAVFDQYPDMGKLWAEIREVVYCEEDPVARVGFRDDNGQSSYYTANVTSADSKFVDEFCQSKSISPLNTRLFKHADGSFELKICSHKTSDQMSYLGEHDFQEKKIRVTASDFTEFMRDVVASMEQAVKYAANDHQQKMVTEYINHFRFGDVDKHKESQRHWIKDVGPIVETNIGFIETYLDPSGARAEFEGFVSIVDKEISAKFNTLVVQADDLIKKLPWDACYEKAKFLKPDFTSLDIVAFACSGTPIGINIPNYDDIR